MSSKKALIFKILGILITLFMLCTTGVMADTYPSKPVKLIVPYPPGGYVDTLARLIGTRLSGRIGEQVVIDNRAGGGSVIGTEVVARSAPDGYTLFAASGAFTIQPAIQKLPYDSLKDFTPIARVITGPTALVVRDGVPANSVKELIALAKQKPGKLIFVTQGYGGSPHLSIELFKLKADIDFKIVHFKGGGPAIVDLLGGHSDATMSSLTQIWPHVQSGKFKVLATGGETRSAFLPDVPTMMEAGVPGYETVQWFGILAPAGTPASIVKRLEEEIKTISAMNDVKKEFMAAAAEVNYLGSIELGRFIEREIASMKFIVEKAKIKTQN